jgi:hypothetical protein
MSKQSPTKWLQVGEFVANFGGNELSHTDDLMGKTLDIHFDNGWVIRHSFKPGRKMEWQMLQGTDPDRGAPSKDCENYRATCLREGYFLVDFIERYRPTQSVSLLLDLVRNTATAVLGTLPTREETFKPLFQRVLDREELTPMRAKVAHGAIDRPFTDGTPKLETTDELVGKRIHYQYGPKDSYEHIYLNRERYTWNCIQGPEAGLADTDRCYTYKIADEFYLFFWLEKIIPTLGLVMIDLKRRKTSGKIFGYEGNDFGKTSNTPVGAFPNVKNETLYP